MLKKLRVYLSAVIGLSLLVALMVNWQLFYRFSESLNDYLFVSHPVETELVIVAIDDLSLRDQGQWPWSRIVQANLIKKIADQNPEVIVYDINLADQTKDDQEFIGKTAGIKQLIIPTGSWFKSVRAGHVEVLVSEDGKVRRLATDVQGQPAISVLAADQLGYGLADELLEINYRFGRDSWPTVSASQVLAGRDLAKLGGKIVLVGITAPDLHDIKNTPLGPMSGVEVHASAIDTIISGRIIRFLPISQQLLAAWLLALLPLLMITWLGLKKGLISIGLMGLGIVLASIITFNLYYLILPLFYGLWSLFFGVIVAVIVRIILTSSEQRFLKHALGQYVSPHVLDEILRDRSQLSLKGKTYEVTVLFLDIRGFTSFSETKQPTEVVEKLNQLLSIVTEVILSHDGTIDKYIGDAVMAFWGAPLKDKQQATHACQAALEIQERIETETDFKIGIGINHGEAVVGNIGSAQRFDYTAIGDTINLGSRLESATKELPVDLIISQAVVTRLDKEKSTAQFGLQPLSDIRVKGKRAIVKVWALQTK